MNINVCLSSDNYYAQHLAVCIASVLHHKGLENVIFWVMDGGISEKNKHILHKMMEGKDASIHFVGINEEVFRDVPIQTMQGGIAHVSIATYFRLLLPHILPDVEKAIYLDCDLVCRASLAPLFGQTMGDDWIRGVIDLDNALHCKRLGIEKYVCAGVLLLNLKAWREYDVEQKCMCFLRNHVDKILYHDQDVLNVVCQEHLSYLDKTWDAQACETRQGHISGFNDIARTANIIHFIGGRKPWQPGCRHPYRREYFRYLKLTPYRNFVWEYWRKWLRYMLWHTKYSHGRRRWYFLGIRVWQKKD